MTFEFIILTKDFEFKPHLVGCSYRLQLNWKGTETMPYLRCQRTYAANSYQAKTFHIPLDTAKGIVSNTKVIMDVFDLMIKRYGLVLKAGTINQSGGKFWENHCLNARKDARKVYKST